MATSFGSVCPNSSLEAATAANWGSARLVAVAYLLLGMLSCDIATAQTATPDWHTKKPNILLVIMDDVGIDQMKSFGYGGFPGQSGANNIAPLIPNIDAVARAGLRFRNAWSMPECSPGRAVLLTGRYPVRNDILQAIGPADLNNSHVGTWEMTTPKLLLQANYNSAMFGKFHLGGPENNQFKDGSPASIGFVDFYGWTGGLPGPIDTTAGGVGAAAGINGTYSCGFIPSASQGGADSGSCYIPTASSVSCKAIHGTDQYGDSAGRQCLNAGGVLDPNAACHTNPPQAISEAFNKLQNAHYVSPLVINHDGAVEEIPLGDPRSRGFRASVEVNAAIKWINQHSKSADPWMATVSFSADHTPLQPPPGNLLSSATRELIAPLLSTSAKGCTSTGANNHNVQLMSNALTEGMDTEFGRLLVETHIATYDSTDGKTLIYDPQASNTVIVIVGDNGSLGSTVKTPFDPTRSKATAYQTGAWVPVIVSGPMVAEPGRAVDSMINVADLFELFGEVAGIDVHKAVPRPIDSRSMMPYLTNPWQASIRRDNFTQGGFNIQKNGEHNGPCVIPFPEGTTPPPGFPRESRGTCSQVPISKVVCEDNYGVWWGEGADEGKTLPGFTGVDECWQVNQAIYKFLNDVPRYELEKVAMIPSTYSAIRDDRYKIVKNHALNYDPAQDTLKNEDSMEFYEVNQSADPTKLKLDRGFLPASGTCCLSLIPSSGDTGDLSEGELLHYDKLKLRLDEILGIKECPGDGNGDGHVNDQDLLDWEQIVDVDDWHGSSHYDFNFDGITDDADKAIIEKHLNHSCPAPGANGPKV